MTDTVSPLWRMVALVTASVQIKKGEQLKVQKEGGKDLFLQPEIDVKRPLSMRDEDNKYFGPTDSKCIPLSFG